MNIVLRKMALLEAELNSREEAARIQGFTTDVIDRDFKERLTNLMDKVRTI